MSYRIRMTWGPTSHQENLSIEASRLIEQLGKPTEIVVETTENYEHSFPEEAEIVAACRLMRGRGYTIATTYTNSAENIITPLAAVMLIRGNAQFKTARLLAESSAFRRGLIGFERPAQYGEAYELGVKIKRSLEEGKI